MGLVQLISCLLGIVLGQVHSTHPAIQGRLLLLQLLESLGGLSHGDVDADHVCHG